jgi:hypothetical protein
MLSDLFNRESIAKDELRANHAEQLYRFGIAMLGTAPAILYVRNGNVPMMVDSVRNADLFNAGWQAASNAPPVDVLSMGLNLIGLSPPPDAGPYSITFTVVQNAPIPVNDLAYIQAGPDEIDALLDLCVHIAMLKCGGSEFMDTMPLLERFLTIAGQYNRKLNEIGEYRRILNFLSQREEATNPRMDNDDTAITVTPVEPLK